MLLYVALISLTILLFVKLWIRKSIIPAMRRNKSIRKAKERRIEQYKEDAYARRCAVNDANDIWSTNLTRDTRKREIPYHYKRRLQAMGTDL